MDPAEMDRLSEITARLEGGPAPDPVKEFFAFLQASEADALILIAYVADPKKPPAVPDHGDIEAGFLLYWIHHPPPALGRFLAEHKLLGDLFKALQLIAPPTRITTAQYDRLINEIGEYGEPWTDGTLMGTQVYQQLDERWIIAALNYVWNVLDPGAVKPFPCRTPGNVILTRKDGRTDCDPVIGIVGDWGTGYYKEWVDIDCPAKRVIDQITDPAQSPPIDYLVHLGDVYYAGTDWRPEPFEEQNNFYALWPDQGAGRNFTLNSNHEMYGAASGYFDVALEAGGTFVTQNGMSYFAMHYGPWLVLGLDSAYYSDAGNATPEKPRNFYMKGAIGTAVHDQQIRWLQQFRSHQGPIMVMTHHNASSLTGSQTNLLYAQMLEALQRPPTLWYWGHVHNAIVYEHLYDAPADPVPTLGRCCGHAAIPFGNGWGLEDGKGNNLPNIVYYAHTPDDALPHTSGPNPPNPRVKNGYALVTLHQDGGFTEAFYETGQPAPVYQRVWMAAELDQPLPTEPPPAPAQA